MIPSPSRPAREPFVNLPPVVLGLVLGLVGLHGIRELFLSPEADLAVLIDFAVVPARWTVALEPARLLGVLEALQSGRPDLDSGLRLALAEYVLGEGQARPWTALSYALLHGSWAHVLLNTVWLAAFGTPIARRCGTVRFLTLMVVAAAAGAVTHAVLHPLQLVPLVGASAAVSGLMGAAAWFMFGPPTWQRDGTIAPIEARPRESLAELVRNQRVLLFLGVWFGVNFLFAVVAAPLAIADASIAWEAHVGGFVAGLLLFPLLDPVRYSVARQTA